MRTGPFCTGVVPLSLNQVMVGWGLPLALQVKLTDWKREAKTVDGPAMMTGRDRTWTTAREKDKKMNL